MLLRAAARPTTAKSMRPGLEGFTITEEGRRPGNDVNDLVLHKMPVGGENAGGLGKSRMVSRSEVCAPRP